MKNNKQAGKVTYSIGNWVDKEKRRPSRI